MFFIVHLLFESASTLEAAWVWPRGPGLNLLGSLLPLLIEVTSDHGDNLLVGHLVGCLDSYDGHFSRPPAPAAQSICLLDFQCEKKICGSSSIKASVIRFFPKSTVY